jgi:hypothetical protein
MEAIARHRVAISIVAAASLLAGIGGFAYVIRHPQIAGALGHDVATLPGPQWGNVSGETFFGVVQVHVDTSATGRPISPLIYGLADADPATVTALGASLDRGGGDPSTRYNWVNGHAWNAGRDWQFRDVNYGVTSGSAADASIAATLAAHARTLQTVPTIGWVARDDSNSTMSVGVPATGGPRVAPGSDAIAGYDPTGNRQRTSVPSYARAPGPLQDPPDPNAPAVYQDEWIHHLVDRFGVGPQGVQLFAMDNEPDLWSSTHTDVHPARMGYDDMLSNFHEYATAVKAQAPGALVLGPDVSGWASYLYSDLDRGSDNFATHADRQAHGDQPFLPWWLNQVRQQDRASGTRTLDYLDVHYYPQAPGVALSNTADPAARALRIRSTRGLWDPTYTDESWIGTPVMLIPRLRAWIDQEYPGTRLAITEYNWGGESDASGAVALADVLGIFGREGVDLATYWTHPAPDSPAGAAFRLYRNYDGAGAAFGDVSLPAAATQPGIAAFASRHSDTGETDVVLANESQVSQATVQLQGISHGSTSRHCVRPGSGRIDQMGLTDPTDAVTLPPLTICLIAVRDQ